MTEPGNQSPDDAAGISQARGRGHRGGDEPASAGGRCRKDHHDPARKLVHQAVRRIRDEHAFAGLRERDRHQGQLRGDQRRQPADTDQHDCRDRLGRRHHDERPAPGDPVQQQISRRWRHRRRCRQGARRLVRRRPGGRPRRGQMESDPLRQYRSIDELAHRLVRRGRGQEIPGDLGRALRGRQEAEGQGPSLRLRARPRLRRQPRLALPAAVVLRRRRGGSRRQDRGHRFRRDRARRGFLPQVLQGHDARRRARLDRREQQQGLDGASRSPAPTMPKASCGSPSASFPKSARSPTRR